MNGCATEVTFILQNKDRDALGRRSLKVTVCSCPKRDKEKEEAMEEPKDECPKGKRKMNINNSIIMKKPKSTATAKLGTQAFNFPMTIIGQENFKSVLKVAHEAMAASAFQSGNSEMYKPHMEGIENIQKQFH